MAMNVVYGLLPEDALVLPLRSFSLGNLLLCKFKRSTVDICMYIYIYM